MKTQKNLIVYNTCGIKKDNTYEYPRYIKSLLAQKYKTAENSIKTIIKGFLADLS